MLETSVDDLYIRLTGVTNIMPETSVYHFYIRLGCVTNTMLETSETYRFIYVTCVTNTMLETSVDHLCIRLTRVTNTVLETSVVIYRCLQHYIRYDYLYIRLGCYQLNSLQRVDRDDCNGTDAPIYTRRRE